MTTIVRPTQGNLIIAGLTGGIATGKSQVAVFFKTKGAVILDADMIARDVVKQGEPAWQAIVNHFGPSVLLPDNELNRDYLAGLIFKDPHHRQRLNHLVHPYVFEKINQRLADIAHQRPRAVVIVDVPLLIETRLHRTLTPVILVYVPEKIQIERLMRRNQLTHAEALARVRAQMPIDDKRPYADIIIDNRGDLEDTRRQTYRVFKQLQTSFSKTAKHTKDTKHIRR